MPRTSVVLTEDELTELRRLAEREGRGVQDLLHDAVARLLADSLSKSNGWQVQLDEAVAEIRRGVPAGVTPAEIEADITSALAEARRVRRARRR